MTDIAINTSAAPVQHKGLIGRIVGVIVSPRETYADVASKPRWFGVLAVGMAVAIVGLFILLSTEVGQQALLDQQIQGSQSFGRPLNDAQIQQMENFAPYLRYLAVGSQLVFIPLSVLAISGILLAVFNALLGGDATFKQVLSIVAHSGIIIALQAIFVFPLDYVRETLTSPTTLGVFVPFLDENTFMARFLGYIDLFYVWMFISLAIGLGVLYRRRTTPIGTTLLIIYVVVVGAWAAVRTALSGA